jgi:hypothetical protein
MKVGQLRTFIENKSDSELIFACWYDKDEANDYIINNLGDDEAEVTHEEWIEIYSNMVDDEGIWQQMNEAFQYYCQKVIENREKGKTNDDSK